MTIAQHSLFTQRAAGEGEAVAEDAGGEEAAPQAQTEGKAGEATRIHMSESVVS